MILQFICILNYVKNILSHLSTKKCFFFHEENIFLKDLFNGFTGVYYFKKIQNYICVPKNIRTVRISLEINNSSWWRFEVIWVSLWIIVFYYNNTDEIVH